MSGVALILAAAVALTAPAGGRGEGTDTSGPLTLTAFALRYDYLRRESAAEQENYHRLTFAFETSHPLFNPRVGVEVRYRDSQLRCYWVGDDLRVSKRSTVHLRWNHTEYGDWETSINYFNAYISYKIWWFRLAVGLGYAALNFEPEHYQNPLLFRSDTPETRFIYNLSLHPTLGEGRLELNFGLRNHNDFEYAGFDETSLHFEALLHLTDKSSLSFFYERRYTAAFISVPTLSRLTWMISFEQRF